MARVHMHAHAGAVVVSIRGEIDVAATVGIKYVVGMALQAPFRTTIVIDLTAARHSAATVLQTLADAHRDAGGERQPLRIVLDRARQPDGPIQATTLPRVLALYDELDDAINARPAGQAR